MSEYNWSGKHIAVQYEEYKWSLVKTVQFTAPNMSSVNQLSYFSTAGASPATSTLQPIEKLQFYSFCLRKAVIRLWTEQLMVNPRLNN